MAADLEWPFGELPRLEADDIRETAYETFFMSCRSSPGFGGRSALMFHSSMWNEPQPESTSSRTKGVGMAPSSRVKRTLGLKMLNRTPSKKMAPGAVSSPCPQGVAARPKRPLTSAELMRQQMRVTEQSDNWLRKTLARTHLGHVRKSQKVLHSSSFSCGVYIILCKEICFHVSSFCVLGDSKLKVRTSTYMLN